MSHQRTRLCRAVYVTLLLASKLEQAAECECKRAPETAKAQERKLPETGSELNLQQGNSVLIFGASKVNQQHNERKNMEEPGLDDRHRDQNPPKAGEIQQKRGDTLNKNLPKPIPEFSPNAKLETMRKETGETSVEAVREAAKDRKP